MMTMPSMYVTATPTSAFCPSVSTCAAAAARRRWL